MALYQFRGRDGQGEEVQGRLEAESADAVAGFLSDNQIIPIDIQTTSVEEDALTTLRQFLPGRRVALIDLIFFSRQMYTLVRAGVPILESLQGLRDSTPSERLGQVIGEVRDDLDAGQSLSAALRRHPEVFPSLYVSIIEIGEASGRLPESFLQLVSYLEQERDTRERIRAAMRYPLIIIVAIVAAVFVINLFVIPSFAQVFARFGADLPLPTRMLIATSNFTLSYWWLMLLALGGALYGARVYTSTEAGRRVWHRFKLHLPVVGNILYRATMGRFARALAICVHSGVPWGQAMRVVTNAVDNQYLAERVAAMREGVERGESITHTATTTGLFPPLVLQMIQVGEQTGAVDRLLNEVGEYYEREVDYQLKYLSSAIEPVLLAAMGVIVLILALGVFLPMWDLGSVAFSKH